MAAAQQGHVADVPAGDWWLSLVAVVYWSGCRIGALIQTPAANYDGASLLVSKQKNRRSQRYALPASCCETIDRTRPAARALLWPVPWHPTTIWPRMRKIVEAAGLPCPKTGRQLFHRLRRTCLSYCTAADPAIAQRQAGHANYATTLASYIDPRIVGTRTAADVLPDPMIGTFAR